MPKAPKLPEVPEYQRSGILLRAPRSLLPAFLMSSLTHELMNQPSADHRFVIFPLQILDCPHLLPMSAELNGFDEDERGNVLVCLDG